MNAKVSFGQLLYSLSSGVRLMRAVVTLPVTVWVHIGAIGAHARLCRPLMIAGLAKPMVTWKPAGPNSWK